MSALKNGKKNITSPHEREVQTSSFRLRPSDDEERFNPAFTLDVLEKVASALDVSVDKLLK